MVAYLYVKAIFILRVLHGDDIALETKPGNPIHRFILTLHHRIRIMCSIEEMVGRMSLAYGYDFAHQWFGCIF